MSLQTAIAIFNEANSTPDTLNRQPQNARNSEALTPEVKTPLTAENMAGKAQAQEVQTQAENVAGTAQTQTAEEESYSHFTFAEACRTVKAPSYLIYGEVKSKGLHMTYGDPASGKTFYVIDKAASIACEDVETWHGKPIKHGQVVYFAGEASEGVKVRCAGWAVKNGIDPEKVKMTIFDEVFSLDDEKDLKHTIEKTLTNIQKFAPNAVYVIFDTLHAFMAGDENLAVDTRKFLAVCRVIMDKFNCAIEIIHHVGVSQDAKGRARGSSSWRGAMDIETLVVQTNHSEKGITCSIAQKKHKDGKLHKDIILNMNEVEIPNLIDDAGLPVTTLAPELNEERTREIEEKAEQEKAERKKPKYTPNQLLLFEAYEKAAKEYGFIVCDNEATKHETIWVEAKKWKEMFCYIKPGDNEKSKKSTFYNVLGALPKELKVIELKRERGIEYHCLDLSGNADPAYKIAIRAGIKEREQREAENKKAAEAMEGDTTGNLF